MSTHICLDPGHGHKRKRRTGAADNGLIEDDLALTLAHKIKWYLTEADVSAVITRPDAKFVTLKDRVKIAKREKATAFISLHFNAAGSAQANGLEAFVAKNDYKSHAVASELLLALGFLGMTQRGVKWDSQSQHKSLYVLRNTYSRMYAVLLEVGFLTNPADAAVLKDEGRFEQIAAALAGALKDI